MVYRSEDTGYQPATLLQKELFAYILHEFSMTVSESWQFNLMLPKWYAAFIHWRKNWCEIVLRIL